VPGELQIGRASDPVSALGQVFRARDEKSQFAVPDADIEWIWRVRTSPNPWLGKFEVAFNDINSANFRDSLHSFVAQSTRSRLAQKVMHAEFKGLNVNGRDVGCRGWIDFNQQLLTVWMIEKRVQLPDVVILRFNHLAGPTKLPLPLERNSQHLTSSAHSGHWPSNSCSSASPRQH
jgi:hypothetical protein